MCASRVTDSGVAGQSTRSLRPVRPHVHVTDDLSSEAKGGCERRSS